MAFHLNLNDLTFILKQIRIAERHVDSGYTQYVDDAGTPIGQLVPYGLRTVGGDYNNLVQLQSGAADLPMPRLLTPDFRSAPTTMIDFDGAGPAPSLPVTANPMVLDMNGPSVPGGQTQVSTNYAQIGGYVIDAQPRVISNLISDQSVNNPAAVVAALAAMGSADPWGQAQLLTAGRQALNDAVAARAQAQSAESAALQSLLALAPGQNLADISQGVAQLQDAVAQAQQRIADANAGNITQDIADAAPEQTNALLQSTVNRFIAQAQLEQAQIARDNALDAYITLALTPGASELDIQVALTNFGTAALAVVAKNGLFNQAQAAYGQDLAALVTVLEDQLGETNEALTLAGSVEGALATYLEAQSAAAAVETAVEQATEALSLTVNQLGLEFDIDELSVKIPNVMPDLGDTAPYNSFMTLFGQFFDHGLDLVSKGGSGTVLVPLLPDDPLYVPGSPTNFMVLTRATNQPGPDGVVGTADDIREHDNETTPWIDLNQVYTSHESHQVFLREYTLVNGRVVSTGHMLEGEHGGPPTWADIKQQAREMLGIELSDTDVGRVPLVAADLYGNLILGPNGYAQLVVASGPPPVLVEGNPEAPVAASSALSAGRAFLNDIAHNADPGNGKLPDADLDVNAAGAAQPAGTYDNELLDRHFIVGDGRGNENIGLTAVHHVFHSEHNHRVEQIKQELLASGNLDFLNEWLLEPVSAFPGTGDNLIWNGERLFQASRFSTEMVYQHLVFEEFARLVSPDIDPFVFSNNVAIDGAIVAEFAHVVYRFGHSMLNETVDRLDADGQNWNNIGLIEAFLNPVEYEASGVDSSTAAGAILRGMTRQVGNEIDEFLTEALRNNLVGLPLDLGAINIARGRETGVPSLNNARAQFFEQTGDSRLAAYKSWYDFALNLKNPASIINFVAAYGTHTSVTGAQTVEAKRDAATLLVMGGAGAPADRLEFLNATGAWAADASLGGLNDVDFWIGGLAEKKMAFGGLLGSTFNFVFEVQMERLQAGDRFYYLSRTQGTNLLNQLESDSFAELVMRNTDLGNPNATHLPSSLFLTPDHILEMDMARQSKPDPVSTDPVLGGMRPLVERLDLDGDGDADLLRFNGGEHVVLGGTQEDDVLVGGDGDDTLWGDGGNDRLEGGYGVDHIFGGDGDDIITDAGNDIGAGDVLNGGRGNDVINGGIGLDLIFGGSGNDFIFGGSEAKDITGGEGNDFISGPTDTSFLKGNEGDDWIEGGAGSSGLDTLAGDNSELFFNSPIIGHDVLNGRQGDNDYDAESGDDIMFQGDGIERNNGMAGFDWAIHKGQSTAADSDLGIPIFVNQEANILRDRFDLVEGLSGWLYNDRLTGRDDIVGAYAEAAGAAAQFDATSPFASYSNALTEEGVARIRGLDQLVAPLSRVTFTSGAGEQITAVVFDPNAVQRDANGNVVTMFDTPSDILLGGGGSDVLSGKAGNDIIDGDRWLNARIAVTDSSGREIGTADGMTAQVRDGVTGELLFSGRTLDQLMLDRTLNPGQLQIVRELLDGGQEGDIDTAVFRDAMANYTIEREDNGFLRVTHLLDRIDLPQDGAGADPVRLPGDGSDLLTNIEQLQFRDHTVRFINNNFVAWGQPVISNPNPVEDELLSVSIAGLVDIDGIVEDTLSYRWQSLDAFGEWRDVGTGPTFAPGDAQVGTSLRVLVSFTDANGSTESLASEPTAPVVNVNDAPQGALTIDDSTPVNTQLLTAVVAFADADGLGDLRFQWQRLALDGVTWEDIEGATEASYAVSEVGSQVRVMAIYTDGNGTEETVVSDPTEAIAPYEIVTGTAAGNLLMGGNLPDHLMGLGGADTLVAGSGNDLLDGGAGADVMIGGAGDDIYVVNAATDQVVELASEGNDTVRSSVSWTLAANLEDLELTGSANLNATGNSLANRLVGNDGDNRLDGGAGADTMSGGAGNDTYIVDHAGDLVTEVANGGDADQVLTSLNNYVLGAQVENLRFTGSGDFFGTGNELANQIQGAAGNDHLIGGDGNDVLRGMSGNDIIDGGAGDDELFGGAGNDVFVFAMGSGADRIVTVNEAGGFDFNPTGGQDLLDISARGITQATFAASVSITAAGGDTVVNFLGTDDSITLVGVSNPASITQQDFVLAT